MIEDDPVLGKYVALHGIDRLRLLFLAGAALGAVGLASYIALGISYAGWVQFITFIVPALVTMAVGWYLLHGLQRSPHRPTACMGVSPDVPDHSAS